MIFCQKTMILLLATTLRRRIWIDSHRCFSVFAKFGSKRVRKTCVEKKYYATFFKEFMQLFLDAFGSAATDVSAFWLKKKNVVFSWNFVFFCSIFWIFAFPANSNGSAATDVSAFWQSHFLQRDFEDGSNIYNGIWTKMVEKSKKCDFSTKRDDDNIDRFPGQEPKSVVNSIKIRCKFHKFPL